MLIKKFSSSGRVTRTLLAAGAAAALCGPVAAHAQSTAQYGLYNTGINPDGMIGMENVDSEYSVTYEPGTGSTPDPGTPLSNSNTYVTDTSNLPFSPADDSTSAFISPFPSYADKQINLGGIYDFTTTFDLSSVSDLSTVSLFGRFEADDNIKDVLINGRSLGISVTDPAYKAFSQTFNLAPDASYLLPGTNTLTFKVYNFTTGSDTDPAALRTEFSTSVPEPSSWAMVGGLSALAAFGGWMRRRQAAV